MQAVILAGGTGTRLRPFTLELPKPLYPIQDRPFLDYLLDQVESFGISEVLLLLGYKAQKIIEYLTEHPRPKLTISCSVTPEDYETGARLRAASGQIKDDFLLMYCDNYCPIAFSSHVKSFSQNSALVQVMAYTNQDGYTKNNLRVENGKVLTYDKSRESEGLNAVDIGYALISRKVLEWLPEAENVNFEKYIYKTALEAGRMYASITGHRYYSIGSFERMALTEQFFSGRKAVFLDRDGTINVRPPQACYVESPDDFIWISGAKEAIKRLNDAGILVLLVSNQPGIARKRLTWEALESIHNKMKEDLREIGAWIDEIYICPHNWDEGCDCRKPQPGLLYQAQRAYDLNIPRDCLLIGDDERDIEAANRADCRSVLVSETYPLSVAVSDVLGGKNKCVQQMRSDKTFYPL